MTIKYQIGGRRIPIEAIDVVKETPKTYTVRYVDNFYGRSP